MNEILDDFSALALAEAVALDWNHDLLLEAITARALTKKGGVPHAISP